MGNKAGVGSGDVGAVGVATGETGVTIGLGGRVGVIGGDGKLVAVAGPGDDVAVGGLGEAVTVGGCGVGVGVGQQAADKTTRQTRITEQKSCWLILANASCR